MTEAKLNIAIIPAAGIGSRMHADRAKQMLELGGVPLLVHTLRRFEQCDAIDQVILVLQPNLTTEVLGLISRHQLTKIARVVAGGAERQDSVYRGLQVVKAETAGIVAVHDAVRPFVRPEEIRAVVARAATTGAAILAHPAIDTIKQVSKSRVTRTLDRRRIYHAQTPQAFRYSIIREAYDRAYQDSFMATDDSQLVERLGHRVSVVEGSHINIKITRPIDLRIAEVIYS
ncbi:MAG TPA: 2-C-methyl-D-erythritol 4-phosphate cytidylyltransferase, partial [Blastocatellia bacterium]|nr:2-C-methyl-D-erythritol 4-phosphate cytidylyltransferase [Blastocatellia bacterium]